MMNPSNNSKNDYPLAAWKKQVGDYGIDPSDIEQKSKLLNQKEQEKLFKKNIKGQESTSAREDFLDYLHSVLINDSNKVNVDSENLSTIKIKELLGDSGVALYKKAIAEENNSENFRKAVFFHSAQEYEGPKWNKKLVLWVGGPSASGKSFGTRSAVEKISQKVMQTASSNSTEKNYVISIDGGIERDLSQMRKMLLEVALSKGYKGIEDLHENTKLTVKHDIKNVALQSDALNVAIPATFTTGLQIASMKKIEKKNNVVQVFAEVVSSDYLRLKDTVEMMGNSRAWNTKKFESHKIEMNKTMPCESKKYESENFKWGVLASIMARKNYFHIAKNPIVVSIKNDLIYVKYLKGEGWIRCSSDKDLNNPEKTLISERDFNNYQAYLKGEMKHPEWGKEEWEAALLLYEKNKETNIKGKSDALGAIFSLREEKEKKSLSEWYQFCKENGLLHTTKIEIKKEMPQLKQGKNSEKFFIKKIKKKSEIARKQLNEVKEVSISATKSVTSELKKTPAAMKQMIKDKINNPFLEPFKEKTVLENSSSSMTDDVKKDFVTSRKNTFLKAFKKVSKRDPWSKPMEIAEESQKPLSSKRSPQ